MFGAHREREHVNADSPADRAAEIHLSHQRVHRAVARKIQELSDDGLDVFEIAATTGFPVALVRAVLRGADTTDARAPVEIATDRPSQPVCATPPKKDAK
jgi:uncharacterized protein (UPF0335 family)